MPTKRRWMTSLIRETETLKTRLPWERGLRRKAFTVRRSTNPPKPAHRATA